MSTPTLVSGFDRDQALTLAAEELRRYTQLLASLDEDQWSLPTECAPWTVRDMAAHVLGNHDALRSVAARMRQLMRARLRRGNLVDAISAMQIADRADLSNDDVLRALDAAGRVSIAARRDLSRLMRATRATVPMRAGKERWSVAYLDDTIYTRDTWMHRIDTCRATSQAPLLTADHDGVIVADIVREWTARHGEPCSLTLTGPAGGTFRTGDEPGVDLELDAIEFCRLLSGRGNAEGLLAIEVGY